MAMSRAFVASSLAFVSRREAMRGARLRVTPHAKPIPATSDRQFTHLGAREALFVGASVIDLLFGLGASKVRSENSAHAKGKRT
jgi:hypothetical protein